MDITYQQRFFREVFPDMEVSTEIMNFLVSAFLADASETVYKEFLISKYLYQDSPEALANALHVPLEEVEEIDTKLHRIFHAMMSTWPSPLTVRNIMPRYTAQYQKLFCGVIGRADLLEELVGAGINSYALLTERTSYLRKHYGISRVVAEIVQEIAFPTRAPYQQKFASDALGFYLKPALACAVVDRFFTLHSNKPRWREVVRLYWENDRCYANVARILDISKSCARATYLQCLKQLCIDWQEDRIVKVEKEIKIWI